DSSIVTGCLTEVGSALDAGAAACLSSAPVAVSAAIVPPEARTAASTEAARTVPTPLPPDRVRSARGGWVGCAGVVAGHSGRAGSNQCSGVAEWAGGAVQL